MARLFSLCASRGALLAQSAVIVPVFDLLGHGDDTVKLVPLSPGDMGASEPNVHLTLQIIVGLARFILEDRWERSWDPVLQLVCIPNRFAYYGRVEKRIEQLSIESRGPHRQ